MLMRRNPGKFENALDEAVWSLSMDGGADEEVGSSSEPPGTWAGVMRDGIVMSNVINEDRAAYPNVTDADLLFLRDPGQAGAIITESSDGFVKVKYYAIDADLNADWDALSDELELDEEAVEEFEAEEGTAIAEFMDPEAPVTAIVPAGPSAAHGDLAIADPVTVGPAYRQGYQDKVPDEFTGATLYVVELASKGDVGLAKHPEGDVIVWIHYGRLTKDEQTPNRRYARNATRLYRARFVHKISPSDKDVKDNIALPDSAFSDSKTLARELRKAGVLASGARVRSFRVEGEEITVFPSLPGVTSYWHAIILTLEDEMPGAGGAPSSLERDGTLNQLLDMEAESTSDNGSVPRDVKNELSITPELSRVAVEYEAALAEALDEVVMRYPPNDEATASELFDDNAPYLVLMTLRGEGIGIWDGDWDAHYDAAQIKDVGRVLKNRLRIYADDSGGGKLTGAMRDAVYEAATEAGYTIGDGSYELTENPRPKSGSRASGMNRNQSHLVRWNVFLNGELVEPVYMPPSLTASEVRSELLSQGYDPRIVVDRPPERRSNLPPHYRTSVTAMRPNAKSPELVQFARAASRVLSKVRAYVDDGGDSITARKTELELYRMRDRLEDKLRPLGLTDNPEALELMERVRKAVSRAPELALETRQAGYGRERAELQERRLASRQWRIENGLEDPPRVY